MARLGDKSKLLELLAETPIVSFACKKLGLDRRTYYRWKKDDKDFREKVESTLSIGRTRINDMAESELIKAINNGNMRAITFWLQYNESRYRPVRTAYVDPINHRHVLEPGEMCRTCGYLEPAIEEYENNKGQKLTNEVLARELFRRVRSVDTRPKSETEMRKMIDDFIVTNNLRIGVDFVDGSMDADDKQGTD